MKYLILLIILATGTFGANGQCTANYSYSGTTDTLTFTNLSVVSNAHYYWNFGDGSGSNDINPVHIFPDNGEYLVTLYGLDTILNCSDFYETWITVTKPDTLTCNILLTYVLGGTNLTTTNLSTNCGWLNFDCDAGPALNQAWSVSLSPLWGPSLFLDRIQAFTSDSINGGRYFKEYYKTVPYQYNANDNYQNCSPNFEVNISYQANGALVTLTSMNKSGADTFYVTGFGNPIKLGGYVVSHLYPYVTYERFFPWLITYQKSDPSNGCTLVKGTQQILVKNPYYVFPPSCAISLQPQPQTVVTGSTVQFIVSTATNVIKHWQQDAGLGFVNLSNAGPYSGVNSDTLTISNVQLLMNNYYYRCDITDSSGFGCHNTSLSAVLNVQTVGINEFELQNIRIYPNPASDYLVCSSTEIFKTAEIKIFNLLGGLMKYSVLTNKETRLDVSDLSNGVYIIEVVNGENISRRKFIKQHSIR